MDLLPGGCGKYILAEKWEPFDLLRQVSISAGLACCPRGLLPVESALSGPSSWSSFKTFNTSDHQTTDAYTIHCEKRPRSPCEYFKLPPLANLHWLFARLLKCSNRFLFFLSWSILQFQQIFKKFFFSSNLLQRDGFSSCGAPLAFLPPLVSPSRKQSSELGFITAAPH